MRWWIFFYGDVLLGEALDVLVGKDLVAGEEDDEGEEELLWGEEARLDEGVPGPVRPEGEHRVGLLLLLLLLLLLGLLPGLSVREGDDVRSEASDEVVRDVAEVDEAVLDAADKVDVDAELDEPGDAAVRDGRRDRASFPGAAFPPPGRPGPYAPRPGRSRPQGPPDRR